MSDDETTINVKGLEALAKAFKNAKPEVHVGILGDSARGKGQSNASIGAHHEFGTSNIPQRSFLRVPIADNLERTMEAAGALDENVLKQVLAEGTIIPWLKKIGVLAEGIVAEGFATGGFGKWAPHSPGYTNNTGQVLVDTQQLRNSITSEVVES